MNDLAVLNGPLAPRRSLCLVELLMNWRLINVMLQTS